MQWGHLKQQHEPTCILILDPILFYTKHMILCATWSYTIEETPLPCTFQRHPPSGVHLQSAFTYPAYLSVNPAYIFCLLHQLIKNDQPSGHCWGCSHWVTCWPYSVLPNQCPRSGIFPYMEFGAELSLSHWFLLLNRNFSPVLGRHQTFLHYLSLCII